MLDLEALLDGLVVKIEPFALCDVGAQVRLPAHRERHVSLHYVLSGQATLHTPGALIRAGPRSLILVPARLRHWIETRLDGCADCAPLETRSLQAGLDLIRAGSGDRALIACGLAEISYRGGLGVFDFLQEPMVVCARDDPKLAGALEALLQEMADPGPATRAVAQALLKAALALVLRSRTEALPWLAALDDPRLGRAIAAIANTPEASHSVESLAVAAGMSRSAFAAAFQKALGTSPMGLLKQIRLNRAARLLATTDAPIKSVAGAVGYESRSAFSRAFAAKFGASPAAWRAAR